MTLLLVSVGLVLLSSALCSGTEAALFSISIIKVKQLAQTQRKAAIALLNIRENMSRPIATIVILNNIANIVGSIVVGGIATQVLGSQWIGLFSGVLTFLVIIIAEIIPKTLGERYCQSISLAVAQPVLYLTKLLSPLIWLIEKITRPLVDGGSMETTNEAEIKLLAKIGQKEGAIDKNEADMIQRIFELNDSTAADLMTPRVAMTYLEGNATLTEVQDRIIKSPHSRIVVIDSTPDQVIGIALKSELLAATLVSNLNPTIGENTMPGRVLDCQRTVSSVEQTTRADRLLSHFLESKQHLLIVRDEFAGVAGVVSLEDVLEVITGNIVDETDEVEDLQKQALRFALKRRKTTV